MKSNIFRRLLSLSLVLVLFTGVFVPYSAVESDKTTTVEASNAEPTKNEYATLYCNSALFCKW